VSLASQWRRLVVGGAVLATLVAAAGLTSAWASRRAARPARPARPAARPALVEVRPALTRHYVPALAVTRAGAAARGLLGLALVLGAGVHLARAARVRWVATVGALGIAAWALTSAAERLTRLGEVTALNLSLFGQRIALTPGEVLFALGALVLTGVGVVAVVRRGAAAA